MSFTVNQIIPPIGKSRVAISWAILLVTVYLLTIALGAPPVAAAYGAVIITGVALARA